MASLRNNLLTSVTLEEATKNIKLIEPNNNQLLHSARQLGISFGDQ